MKKEVFSVGSVVIEATVTDGQPAYVAKTNFGLCVQASTMSLLFQALADVARGKPTLDDPLRVMDGVDEEVDILFAATSEQMNALHGALPLPGGDHSVTVSELQDSFNSKEGTALLRLLGCPEPVRSASLARRSMSLKLERPSNPGERQVIAFTKRTPEGQDETWVYVIVRMAMVIQFVDASVSLRADVVASRGWFSENALCVECQGPCRGHTEPAADSVPEPLVQHLPPKARVVGSPMPLVQVMADYRAAAVASFKRLSPNPHAGVNAEAIAPLLAYLAGMIRFLVKNGIDRLPDSDLACPWYVVGCSLASQYGLTDAGSIGSFGLLAIDEWDGFMTVMEPEGAHMIRSTPPPGNN